MMTPGKIKIMDNYPKHTLMNLSQVAAALATTTEKLKDLVELGVFIEPIYIADERLEVWLASDVYTWINNEVAAAKGVTPTATSEQVTQPPTVT